MFLTVHALFALIFAKFLPNPFWAFLFGFASHLILDAIPHGEKEMIENWSEETRKKRMPIIALIDGLIMLVSLYFIYKNLNLPLVSSLALVLGSILLDALQGFYILFSKHTFDNFLYSFHASVHKFIKKEPLPMKIGGLIQLFILSLSIYLLILLYK